MEANMPFSDSTLPINPTKAPGSPDERECFDPYPDKSPVTDEPPEKSRPLEKKASPRGDPSAPPDDPENSTNRIQNLFEPLLMVSI